MQETMISLGAIDVTILVAYFFLVFAVAFLIHDNKKNKTSTDYFLAGRNLPWYLVGGSLFASNIGSEHLIGLAGSGANSGVAVAQFEVLACLILLLLGWFFVPFYLRTGVFTMPEFLERRFSPQARYYLTFISILGYILTKISVTIFAGAIVFKSIGVGFWPGALAVVVLTGIYTIFGGLRAVIYTDALQAVLMIFGSILLTVLGVRAVGGTTELTALVAPDFWSMWKPMSDPDFPWTGVLLGAPILGIWYWCTDQYVVQRTLSARGITDARRGSLFAGFLKLLPLFIFVMPGIVCLALSKQGQFELTDTNAALPLLASYVLPIGFKGLFIAGLLAALMSSLSSAFNSCSTLITFELFRPLYPKTSEKRLVDIGKVSTVFLVFAGIAWIPMMKMVSGGLFEYIQSVQAYIAPPVAAVFLVGLLNKKVSSKAAIYCLYFGFVAGILRLVLEINKTALATGGVLHNLATYNFLHFAAGLFGISVILLFILSSVLPDSAQRSQEIQKTFFQKTRSQENPVGIRRDAVLSVVLVLCVTIVWWVFS